MERYVHLENVQKVFDTKQGRFVALRDINLTVRRGEFVSIIGHSGCGKSTLLNLIAGLTDATDGVLLCNGREIAGPGPDRAVVFQNHSLLPWMSCFDNVYPRGRARVRRQARARQSLKIRTNEALALVGLAHADAQVPARDLRRHEAARRHRPRPVHAAQGAAAGRTARRARRAHPRASAGRNPAHRRRQRLHHHHGDARRGRGGAVVGPHRDDDQRSGGNHRSRS